MQQNSLSLYHRFADGSRRTERNNENDLFEKRHRSLSGGFHIEPSQSWLYFVGHGEDSILYEVQQKSDFVQKRIADSKVLLQPKLVCRFGWKPYDENKTPRPPQKRIQATQRDSGGFTESPGTIRGIYPGIFKSFNERSDFK